MNELAWDREGREMEAGRCEDEAGGGGWGMTDAVETE